MSIKDELLKDLKEALDKGMSQVRADGTRELDVRASVEYLTELGYRKVDDVKELIIKFFAGWKAHYPESVFLPRPVGEHSPTFDGCAGRTMRAMVPIIEKKLLEEIEEWMTETDYCSEGAPKEGKPDAGL